MMNLMTLLTVKPTSICTQLIRVCINLNVFNGSNAPTDPQMQLQIVDDLYLATMPPPVPSPLTYLDQQSNTR